MRYRFIEAEKATYPIGMLCRVLVVARSGYYAWCRRPTSARAQENVWLETHLRAQSLPSMGTAVALVPGPSGAVTALQREFTAQHPNQK